MSEPTPLHRLFGLSWTDFLQGTDVAVEVELDLSLKQQYLDLILIRKGAKPIGRPLPDGFEQLAPFNLLTFKSHQESLDGWTLCELIGHYVNYRKQISPSMQELLPETEFRLFAVCVRQPRNLLNAGTLQPVRPGVYDAEIAGLVTIRVVVVHELPCEEHNAMLHLFSAREESLRYAAGHYLPRSTDTSSLIYRLFEDFQKDFNMAPNLKEFVRETIDEILKKLPPQERMKGLTDEERMKGIAAEKRLAGLSPEELQKAFEAYQRLLQDESDANDCRPQGAEAASQMESSMLSRREFLGSAAACGGLATAGGSFALSADDPKSFQHGVVATVQPLATVAGINALRRGGNAVDAAIAAAVTLGIVDQHNSGLGGGCFILIRQANGKFLAIDGREMAPSNSSRDMYLREGKPQPELSQTGPLAVATPGALAAYELALARAGKLRLADVIGPAADVAEKGFALDRNYARKLKSTATKLQQFPGSAQALLKADGSAYAEGEILKQPDLANTYRQIAKQGLDWFYRGEFAHQVGDWMKDNGGLLTAADFAAYKPILREPLQTKYRQYQIIGFPPPSSGGVHVAQMLNMLEQFNLAELSRNGKNYHFEHVVAETMKLAFADRAYWLGDPDFAKVPRGLIDKEYARALAARISENTIDVPMHGRPPRATENVFTLEAKYDPAESKHTTHIAAADAEGNWVGITATVNTTFGSKVIVPGTGLVLNNEMDDFSISPGQPNAFGLIGAEANAVQPGKRPLSSMSPTIVLHNDQPLLTVGAAGGPTIITQVLQVLVRTLDLQQSLTAAVAAPRIHHQWRPDELRVENSLAPETVAALKSRGHKIDSTAGIGICQAVGIDPVTKQLIGVHDPRVSGIRERLVIRDPLAIHCRPLTSNP